MINWFRFSSPVSFYPLAGTWSYAFGALAALCDGDDSVASEYSRQYADVRFHRDFDAVLSDPHTRHTMGVAGRAHAEERFGAATASERYAELYRSLLRGETQRSA